MLQPVAFTGPLTVLVGLITAAVKFMLSRIKPVGWQFGVSALAPVICRKVNAVAKAITGINAIRK
jgi:hypothetical protein